MTVTPTVAIVGRPNVGKSTLFNRLVGRRQAIVHGRPGVTRDRITGLAELSEGGRFQLVDTGGLVPGEDPLGLSEQVEAAVAESDLLLLILDGKTGLTPADEEVWRHLRSSGKPTLAVVNKGDTNEARDRFSEFYRLGIESQLLVSAEHGLGIEDLRDAIGHALPELPEAEPTDAPAVAIVGRPNVGKSSLLNRIAGESRVLVSPVPGTTRDPVDTLIRRSDREYLLIDTAGIRRRSKVSDAPEELAVMMARRQIERARLVVLVIDATAGVTTGDLSIAGTAWELGRAVVVAVNKWDLLDEEGRRRLDLTWPRLEELLARPLRVNVSALTGRALDKLFPAIDRALEAHGTQLPTAEVNRLFEEAVRRRRPPAVQGRPWKLYYATQVTTAPPTFMLFANRGLPRKDAYRRYLENRLREVLDLPGVPVRLVIRGRKRPPE
ncbi:MAG: ribosome biogenesis GTPase Der [Thermoanaerobaculia bacterium]